MRVKPRSSPRKELAFARAPAVLRRLRAAGKVIVQCHGTFDLLHPGHIVHLQEARALGDVLVVTLTADRHVNKGPGRPVFNQRLRARALAALACVDYVVVVPHPAAVEAIECVRPHIYCKGREYADPGVDVTGNIRGDLAAVQRLGGKVRYVGSLVFSSTRVLNRFFGVYPPEAQTFFRRLAARWPVAWLRQRILAWPEDLAAGGPGRPVAAGLVVLDGAAASRALGRGPVGGPGAFPALRRWARRCQARRVIALGTDLSAVGVDWPGPSACAAPALQAGRRLSAVRRAAFRQVAGLATRAGFPLPPCLFVALMAASLADGRAPRLGRGRLLKGCEAALNL